ncbi:HAD-like domain [Pseudocohnilembus persalinus]|uniref:Mitochondrial import inner membrane translocase subunit TIM50 n=1 Tax=Pseudocohnilembus persalinus TaxID=266149 RepID=A0A0V0R2P9_PSEPJ|nr:HAD-like domain [Pseudocohnilembus persalinus]|eukprot:KRX08787.1 HAD-like domain [Pseudocohnilembus persalinus]
MQEFLLRNTSELLHIQDEKDQPQQVLSSQKLNNQYQFYQQMNDMYRSKQIQLQKNKNYQRINAQNYEAPRLPNKTSNKKYTLVLDIDETLVHTQFNGDKYKVIKRPFVQEFLQKLSIFYEIVTFTAGTKEYADSIIDEHLDPENKWISHRLYRNNCKWFIDKSMNNERFCIKDVSKINRDINTVLIIDNIADNFSILQPFNGIEIFSYEGIFDRMQLKN